MVRALFCTVNPQQRLRPYTRTLVLNRRRFLMSAWHWSSLHQRNASARSRLAQAAIERRQRQALPHGELEIRGVVGGEPLLLPHNQNIAEHAYQSHRFNRDG